MGIPILNISHNCNTTLANFKITTLSDLQCTESEFNGRHRHDYFEIIWLKNGNGNHKIDLEDHYYAGSSLFILAPGQIHQIEQNKVSEGFLIKFLPSIFENEKDFNQYVLDTCLFDTKTSCPVINIPSELIPIFEELFSQIIRESGSYDEDTPNILASYLKIVIAHINRLKRQKISKQVSITDPHYVLFREFKMCVEQYYRIDHSVKHYADKLNTQSRTLNMVTKKFTNKSASELIHGRLVLEAERILFHEAKSVKEICYDLGFDDPAYFTRFFKKHTGLAPNHFKSQKAVIVSNQA